MEQNKQKVIFLAQLRVWKEQTFFATYTKRIWPLISIWQMSRFSTPVIWGRLWPLELELQRKLHEECDKRELDFI